MALSVPSSLCSTPRSPRAASWRSARHPQPSFEGRVPRDGSSQQRRTLGLSTSTTLLAKVGLLLSPPVNCLSYPGPRHRSFRPLPSRPAHSASSRALSFSTSANRASSSSACANRSSLSAPPYSAAPSVSCRATSGKASDVAAQEGPAEAVFFDGGTHYGDFIVNFLLGFTGVWLPFTLNSVFRTLYLRYRFTDKRFTILSGLSESDRRDYPYSVVAEVRCVPRFIGEWGDILITLTDKTVVELKAVPKFRQVAGFCEERARGAKVEAVQPGAATSSAGKGF